MNMVIDYQKYILKPR